MLSRYQQYRSTGSSSLRLKFLLFAVSPALFVLLLFLPFQRTTVWQPNNNGGGNLLRAPATTVSDRHSHPPMDTATTTTTELSGNETFEFLIGSDAFWSALQADMLSAQQRVALQAMTLEGDSVGLAVVDTLIQQETTTASISKTLCVDRYTDLVISDTWVYGTQRFVDPDFAHEIQATKQMFQDARNANITVYFTNPLGFMFHRYPNRNHKKMMLIDDDIAYIGGINFSEHNFAWHDIMT